MDLLQYDDPILDPIGRAANGKLIKDLALGQNPKRYRERGDFPCAPRVGRNGKITSQGGCFFSRSSDLAGLPFPIREPLAASVWRKYGRKNTQLGFVAWGFELGFVLRD